MLMLTLLDQITEQLQAADLYYGHGTDNAGDEAFALICFALGLPFDWNDEISRRELIDKEIELVSALAKARIETRKPLPYLTHEAYFAELKFYVDERVLIPRSPFAELIENQFQPWVSELHSVLDLCTGSGCMAIATADYCPKVMVDAVDLSQDALDVAKINCEKFDVSDQVHLIQSNLFENVPPKKYDLIISNPPYVDKNEAKTFPAEYQHEPTMALETDDDALDIVNEIIRRAPEYLSENGVLIVELGDNRERLEKQHPVLPFVWLEFERGGGDVFLLTRSAMV